MAKVELRDILQTLNANPDSLIADLRGA